ncbi:MAG: condensation domain-containing protein, partial [Blastocatellia bacterium]
MASGSSKRLPGASARDPRRDLLARLIKKETGTVNATGQIPPRQSGEATPLSFAQERLWFLQQWEPDNPAYNVARAYRLIGPLDGPILAQSVDLIARRHEALRTTFPTLGDQPVQSIARTLDPILRSVDLRGVGRGSQETEIARLTQAEARHRFDLATGPLLRLLLCQFGREDHVLVLAAHQIIFDGRSLDIFYRELEALYANRGDAKGANLPQLTIQYADYALRQREELTGDALTTPLTYWKTQLSGALPALELPADRPRPARQSLAGSRSEVVIDRALTDRLKALSRRSAVTLFVTLMAAFKVLLRRYTAQDDIIVGFPVASRDRPELENLIGFFVNTLPLRTDLSGDPSFRALLVRVRAGTQGALAHRELPFERLVEGLAQKRDLSRNLLFQTMFTFQN